MDLLKRRGFKSGPDRLILSLWSPECSNDKAMIYKKNIMFEVVKVTLLLFSFSGYKQEKKENILIYRVIQNKRAKIKQDIGDAPLNNLR